MNASRSIFSELTPSGRGGISTIALLGPDVYEILGLIFVGRRAAALRPGQLVYGRVVAGDGRTIDEVVVCPVSDPGEAAEVEIHCHGGPAPVAALAARLSALGLEHVDWPEYLKRRAAARGASRIELEAELLLPHLATLPAAMLVVRQRNGLLAEAVERARGLIASGRPEAARAALERLLAAYESIGRRIERPPRVAILGAPNVGKSSLLNRLVGRERAIVTEVPGTTRDVVTETSDLDGLPAVLADTAGLRETGDLVEQLGVERARAEALQADVLLYLVDLSRPASVDEEKWIRERPARAMVVGTKADLVRPAGGLPAWVDVATSAVTGEGLQELRSRILVLLGFRWPGPDEAVPFTSRQAEQLRAACEALAGGRAAAAGAALHELASAPPQAQR